MRTSQNGNVLFLILIAVALFAALSYAVTRSSRSGRTDISKDVMQADAARLIHWAAASQAMVQKMRLIGGIDEGGYGFVAMQTGSGPTGATPVCDVTSTSKCQFFQKYGYGTRMDGMTFPDVPKKYFVTEISNFDYVSKVNGQGGASVVRVKGLGLDTKAELVFQIQGLRKEFCKAINKQLKISNVDPDINVPEAAYSTPFPEPTGTSAIGDTEPSLVGQTMFCYHNTSYFGGTPYSLNIVLFQR